MDRRALVLLMPLACAPAQQAGVRRVFDEPVDALFVDVAAGDVRVEVGTGDGVTVERAVRGVAGHVEAVEVVENGVLRVEAACETLLPCAVDVVVTVPADLPVDVRVGEGDVRLRGLAGDVDVEVGDGHVVARDLRAPRVRVQAGWGGAALSFAERPEDVAVSLAVGDVRVDLPAGGYALDAQGFGPADVSGLGRDPEGPRVYARTTNGRVTVAALD